MTEHRVEAPDLLGQFCTDMFSCLLTKRINAASRYKNFIVDLGMYWMAFLESIQPSSSKEWTLILLKFSSKELPA